MARYFKIILLLILLSTLVFAQYQNIRFERITVEGGLPNSVISDILQDHSGFMWIATEDGLCKYDGYTFTIYRHNPEDSTTIGSSWVADIYEDRSGCLWLATVDGGLNKYDREKDVFVRYKYNQNNLTSISSSQVECIDGNTYEGKDILWVGTARGLNRFDPKTEIFTRYPHPNLKYPHSFVENVLVDTYGKVWIGCTDGGLHQFDPVLEEYIHYRHDPHNQTSLSSNHVFIIYEDQSGVLWTGTTGGGLNKFDRNKKQFSAYHHDPTNPTSISGNIINSIYEDESGLFWVGTGEGLNIFDREKESFTHYVNDPGDPNSLSDNNIMCINQDKSGVLWIGTWGGINKIDPQKNQFLQIKYIPGKKSSLSDNYITSVYESFYGGENILWIGTQNGGLNKLNRSTGEISWYKHIPENANSLTNNFVQTICEGDSGMLWIGNFHGGLNKLDRTTGKITRYKYDPDNPNSLSCQSVRCLTIDKSGLLWIGTQTGGINTFDPKTEQFQLVSKKMIIFQIYIDKSDEIWAATMQGLKKLDRETGRFTTFWHNPADSSSISHNFIMTLFESKAGDLWIGTYGAGLDLFYRESGKFIHYTSKDGLPSDNILSILDDEENNLWIATQKGISKFNPVSEIFKNYDFNDGLTGDEFNVGACFKCRDGQLLFGSINGLNAFYPQDIKDNQHIPPVFITNFLIYNKPVQVKNDATHKGEYALPGNISTLNMIKLPYTESVFSFEFAALDYHSPQKNQYAYQMEGVDPDWVFTNASRRFATYTQLNPGEYVFRVKASNNNGYWNEQGTALKVIILPPWWRTKLAYAFYIVFFVSVIIATWRLQVRRVQLKNQLKMEQFQAEKLREVDQLKSRFFANISHEFRTPLTLIKGPVKQMLNGEIIGNFKEQYRMILRNSERLLSLINQLLDLSKLESGEIKVQVAETDIVHYLKGIILSFSPMAETKKVTLKFTSIENAFTGYIDRDKLEKIITNLLSNAFKFTPEGGEVEVEMKHPPVSPLDRGEELVSTLIKGDKGGCIQLSITNTGPGIAQDQIEKIFDRFYQADDNYKKDSEGSGIGLALTKELVEICHGEISVSSVPNKTTTFIVNLPITKECFKEDEIVKDSETVDRRQEAEKQQPNENEMIVTNSDSSERSPVSRFQSPLILIVEDNPDVTNYICSFMENDYRILTAENGKIGLKKILDKYPDLIISDVMMPEMDGFELCQKIKSDERISHIPVILLTAKADLESRIEGLEYGADDYISKPFEAEELKIRSKNLIEQRKRLREKFSRIIDITPGDVTASSMDEQFLNRLISVFEEHISESGYSTDHFAQDVGLSKTHLNRKLRAVTDLSTHGFILNLRLKKAAQLLKKKAATVSEIAYSVGFESPSKFARAFRNLYGKSPSDFSSQY